MDENLVEYLILDIFGGEMTATLDERHDYRDASFNAHIVLPGLESLVLEGESVADVRGFDHLRSFSASLSGNSRLTDTLIVSRMELNLEDDAEAAFTGSATTLILDGDGNSRARLWDFPVETAVVVLEGRNSSELYVTGQLHATLSERSVLVYRGDPELGDITVEDHARLEEGG